MYADDTTINFNLKDFTHLKIEMKINDEISTIYSQRKYIFGHFDIKCVKDKINDYLKKTKTN